MRLYLAGPMRGYKNFNFPAFDKAAQKLREMGHEVFSPAEKDRQDGFDETRNTLVGFDLAGAMKADLRYIVNEAEGIALMNGWRDSSGAQLEATVAQAIGLRLFDLGWLSDDELRLADITDYTRTAAKATIDLGVMA